LRDGDFISEVQGQDDRVKRFAPEVGSIRDATSTYAKPIPLSWGQTRIAGNLLWVMRWFHTSNSGTLPHLSIHVGMCEGPVTAFRRMWWTQRFFQAPPPPGPFNSFQVFPGSYSQNPALPHGFDSSTKTDLSYRGIAYFAMHTQSQVASQLPQIPMANFEIAGPSQVGSIAALAKTVMASAGTFSSTAHGFAEFQCLRFTSSGALPSGIVAGTDYFCANVTADTFQVRLNPWDTVVVAANGGSGTITATPFVLDANPKDVVVDFLTNPKNGSGFPAAQIGDLTAFVDYCRASGSFVSPKLDAQESARTFLERLAVIGFSGLVFSEGVLKIVPYCDTEITGFGVTFTPDVSAVYPLTDDNFIRDGDNDPVRVKRVSPGAAYNAVKIEFENRLNQYAVETVEVRDEASIKLSSYRPKEVLRLHEIKDPAIAKWVATLILWREQGIRNTYSFRLPAGYLLLEPMDLLTLTESTGTPLVDVPVRITEIEEGQDGIFDIIAEDFPIGSAIGVRYPNQVISAYAANFNESPGDVNAPVLFVGPYLLSIGELQLWMAVSGGAEFGGCEIWGSYDEANGPYAQLGVMPGKSTTGLLTSALPIVADPDTTTVLGVDLTESAGVLASVTAGQAANGDSSLCYAGGELFSFTDVAETAQNKYNLTNLRRGLYGTPVSSVAIGGRFVFVSGVMFKFPFPPEFTAARTLYLKFLAFNTFGVGIQSLDDVSEYEFVLPTIELPAPTNVVLASGTAELLLQSDGTVVPRIKVTWTPPAFSRVTGYELQFKRSSDSVYSDAPAVPGLSSSLAWIVGVRDGINYDVRIRSVGAIREVSDWVTIANHLVVGKTEKPTNVGVLSFTDPVLSWQPVTDFDLAGYIVRYQPSGSNDWATASPAHVDGFITETNFDTGSIVGGSTRLLVKSVDTSGNEATAASTLVVDLRPAQPTSFFISRQPDGTREFTWATTTPPADLDGARIRYLLGSTSDWDAMTPLHTGLLKASPFETNQLAAGTYTFASKNVDKAGNESAAAVFITSVTIGDPRIGGSIEDFKEEPAWTETKTNAIVDGATGWLVASGSGVWNDIPTTWDAWNGWIVTPSGSIQYERKIDVGIITTFIPLVTVVADSVVIEEAHSDVDSGYSSFAAVGPEISARFIKIRVTVTGSFPKIKAMRTILSADLIEEIIEDLDTSTLTGAYDLGVGNIRLPIVNTFSVIKKVDVSLQNVGPGWSWELIDKDTSVGPNIKIYNATPALADATIDATIKGV